MEQEFKLPCHIEAPASMEPKARYAIDMLLLPLGIRPVWVEKNSLEEVGLYYGMSNAPMPPGIIHIGLNADTCSFFDRGETYNPGQARWRFWENERWPVLFGGSEEQDDDLIASTFFWLSGWQEYTTKQRDVHGRFPYSASLQAKFGLADRPVVDAYRERLAQHLIEHGLSIHRRNWIDKSWAFCPTHDIDYLRKWRPGMVYREVVHYLLANHLNQSLLKRAGRFGRFLFNWAKPGDEFRKSLRRIIHETERRGGKGTYFFKTAAHGPNDVYYSLSSPFVKRTIGKLKEIDFEIGLHPSYFAYNHPDYLQREKRALEEIYQGPVTSVRQHYLRYENDTTARMQLGAGFQIDSTLGFAGQEGFRRGTCHPFTIYDVNANAPTELWELTLSVMDGTLFNRRNLDGEAAIEVTRQVMRRCKRFGGICVALWHNTLWDELDFPEWGEHFLRVMDVAVEEEAYIHSLSNTLEIYLRGFNSRRL